MRPLIRFTALATSVLMSISGLGVAWAGPADLDTAFGGGDGIVRLPSYCSGSLVQAHGNRIYTAGDCMGAGSGESSSWIRAAKPSGETVAETGFRAWCYGFAPGVTDIFRLPGGEVLVIGFAASNTLPGYIWVGRFTSELQPVESWGSIQSGCGLDAPGFRAYRDYDFTSIAGARLDSAGRIVIAGTVNQDAAVLRLDADGSPDGAFGVDGLARLRTTAVGERLRDVALTSADDIYLAGEAAFSPYGSYRAFVTKLDDNGDLDLGWSGDGTRLFGRGSGNYYRAQHLQVTASGDLVVGLVNSIAGYGGASRVGLARLSPDGADDATFATDGRIDIECPGKYYLTPMTDVTVHPREVGGYRIQLYLACRSDGKTRGQVVGVLDTGAFAPAFGDGGRVRAPWAEPIRSADLAMDGSTLAVTYSPDYRRGAVLVKLGDGVMPRR